MFLDKKTILNNYTIIVIIPIITFWLILFFLGYPKPMADDLYFTGGAINIVKHGEFYNPWLRLWTERATNRFYLQPPFHSWTLAGWLSIFGINTQSLLLFQCLCYITFSVAIALILKKYNFPKFTPILLTLIFATWMLKAGLRMDGLAMAYLAIGLFLLINNKLWRYFLGFCFLGASILSSAIMVAYATPLSLAILIGNFSENNQSLLNYLQKIVLALLLAFFLIFTLFLLAINFELTTFLGDLSWVASWRRNENLSTILSVPSRKLFVYPLWLLGGFLGVWIFILKRDNFNKKIKTILFSLIISLCLTNLIYTNVGSLTFANFNYFYWVFVIIAISDIYTKNNQKINLILILLTLIALLSNQSYSIFHFLSQKNVPLDKYENLKNQVSNLDKNQQILFDDVAARYIFNYQLPIQAIDWNYSKKAPSIGGGLFADKPTNDVWIISTAKRLMSKDLPEFEKAELFGHKFNTIPKYPDDIMIIK